MKLLQPVEEQKDRVSLRLLSFDPARNALLLFYSACASCLEVETQTAEPSP